MNNRIKGIIRIDRVVEMFEIWTDEELPIAKFKVKILHRNNKDFLGIPNIAVKNPQTGEPEWISGLGNSIEETLKDTLLYFFKEIERNRYNRPLTEDDFCWADPDDF